MTKIDEEPEPEPGPESIAVYVTNPQPIEISVLNTEVEFRTTVSNLSNGTTTKAVSSFIDWTGTVR